MGGPGPNRMCTKGSLVCEMPAVSLVPLAFYFSALAAILFEMSIDEYLWPSSIPLNSRRIPVHFRRASASLNQVNRATEGYAITYTTS